MKLRYVINGIGIYVEDSNSAIWNTLVASWLQRELDISLAEVDENQVKQKIHIKPYSLLNKNTVCQGFVTPNYSIYSNGLYLNLELKIAVKVERDYLVYWLSKEFLSDVLYASFTFPFFLQLLFIQRNMVFVHSVGIVVDGKGILLPAFPGMNKTSFVSKALRAKNVKMLGDEYSLIDKDGYLHPYPQHFFLTTEHRPFFPEYFENHNVTFPSEFNLGQRILRRFRYILSNLNIISVDKEHYYILVTPSLLFSKTKIADKKVPIDSVYVLRSWRGIREMRVIGTENIDKIADFCVSATAYEMDVMQRLNFNVLAQSMESLSEHYGLFENIVREGLEKSSGKYLVDIPETWDAPKVAEELFNLVVAPH